MGVDDDDADEALLVAGRSDAEAFGLFYGRRVDAVLAFFLRRTGDRELAADLTAETFAAALSALPRFNPQRSSALAWLFTIAHHQMAQGRHRIGICLASVDAALRGVEIVAQLLAGMHRPTLRRYRPS